MRNGMVIVALNGLLAGQVLAHDGIMPHPATASEMTHFAVHVLMALPVVAGAWLLAYGIKRFLAQRSTDR